MRNSKLAGDAKKITHTILNHLREKNFKNFPKYCCLLLNIKEVSPKVHNHFDDYKYIWDQAHFKIAVDGSANILNSRNLLKSANIISGDFDSISPQLLSSLRADSSSPKSPQLLETPNQNETDFTKALNVASSMIPQCNHFIALYYHNGHRQDHFFGLMNTLHKKFNWNKYIYLLNIKNNTLTWRLKSGKHVIEKHPDREFCSVVPLNGDAKVSSTGLEYDMLGNVLSMSGSISTSNISKADTSKINISTNNCVIWTITAKMSDKK